MNIIEFFKNIFQMFIDWISNLFSKPTTTLPPKDTRNTARASSRTTPRAPRVTTVIPIPTIMPPTEAELEPEPEYEEMYRM